MENYEQSNKTLEDPNVSKFQNNNIKRKSFQIKKSIENLSEIVKNKIKIKEMAGQSIEGKTENELRSILWRIYLDIISYNTIEEMNKDVSASREEYNKKISQYKTDDYILFLNSQNNQTDISSFLEKLENFNIFKGSEKSTNQNNFLESINLIKLDVNRTFQDIDLFRNKKIIESISKILYIWNFENFDTGYCQGMNEIVGTIYYALFPSYLLETSEKSEEKISDSEKENFNVDSKNNNDGFYLLNSEIFVEADVYVIFSQIMKRGFKDLYNYHDRRFRPKKQPDDPPIKSNLLSIEDINKMEISDLKKRIYKIFFIYLQITDNILYEFISEICDPFIFLFRWILCILNREISIKNIIYVWDAIFAIEFLDRNFENYVDNPHIEQTHFHFLDFLCVAMIKNLKHQIIKEEDSGLVLSTLMNFPNENNIRQIISDALIIRDEIISYLSDSVKNKKRSKYKIDKNYIVI